MPPFVPRKRARSPSPAASPRPQTELLASKRAKKSLFQAVDAPSGNIHTVEQSRQLLAELNDDDDDDDELSDADSDDLDFEDVVPSERRNIKVIPNAGKDGDGVDSDDDDDDDDEADDDGGVDWEDAIQHPSVPLGTAEGSLAASKNGPSIGDVSFSIKEDGGIADEGIHVPGLGKKGPSKREKRTRTLTHCMHVQTLLWHNTIRNSWLNDKEVQSTLIDGLSEGVKREVTRWRESMGTLSRDQLEAKKKASAAAKLKGKRGRKSKADEAGREWAYSAQHLDQGVPNLSAGDPLLRLLKILTAYWRKRFTITAPGLRKRGYMSVKRLRDEVKDWEKNKDDALQHGERIPDIRHFREMAKSCEGSRDVGAQLFVALLRGLGIETRLVANLQPAGFGFSKAEEADPKKPKKETEKVVLSSDDVVEVKPSKSSKTRTKSPGERKISGRKPNHGNRAQPITLDESDSSLTELPTEPNNSAGEESDDLSVIDITPATPKPKPNKKYDRDLAHPNYWVEACSPVTHRYYPVDPLVLSTIASNEELLQLFEPRGKKAELAKQVMCYTVAFSADGTAKDVTVRYLRKHQLPGKTKGTRLPAEKVPIYNRNGKIKRYEEYDWFGHVIKLYERPQNKRTAADEVEEQSDLKPAQPDRSGKEVEKESLQWYKQSAEYVLEQHLRREEAILPGAKPVRTFTAGKGDKAKEYPVYRRADVVACKTVDSWHKEGRALKKGEQPMKLVPMRAVTLIRKREMEDAERETGEKLKQGLYSIDQTDWIIPPPIQNGVIPKNAFGNMDVYVPTMIPRGAVHIPLKGTAKICRKLEIDYAEACTGFEFGKQRAVPVLTGVVVAEEHELLVREAWRAEQEEAKRKEDTKRTAAALQMWRKMLLGLRVIERMRVEYADAGGVGNEVAINPFVKKASRAGTAPEFLPPQQADESGGGFLLPEHDEEDISQTTTSKNSNHEYPTGAELLDGDAEDKHDGDGGFLLEDVVDNEPEPVPPKNHAPITPVSLQSLHQANDGAEDKSDNTNEPSELKKVLRITPARDIDASEPILADADAGENGYNSTTESRRRRGRMRSPKVVVPIHRSSGRRSRKVTPRKSQYFDQNEKRGGDDFDEDASTEAEIVKPRRTTARTRRKAR